MSDAIVCVCVACTQCMLYAMPCATPCAIASQAHQIIARPMPFQTTPSVFGHVNVCATGFKLDTLLKLADVKGTDRKTSLLHFVLDQLLKDSPAMLTLPHQLASVKPAANLQVCHLHQGSIRVC